MRESSGVDMLICCHRKELAKDKTVVLATTGAILINETVEPKYFDVITKVSRQGQNVIWDSKLANLHPWKVQNRKKAA